MPAIADVGVVAHALELVGDLRGRLAHASSAGLEVGAWFGEVSQPSLGALPVLALEVALDQALEQVLEGRAGAGVLGPHVQRLAKAELGLTGEGVDLGGVTVVDEQVLQPGEALVRGGDQGQRVGVDQVVLDRLAQGAAALS